jgi:hypothetical protein
MERKNTRIYIGVFASMAILCIVFVAVGYFVYMRWDKKSIELKSTQDQVTLLQSQLEDAQGQISGLNQETALAETTYNDLQSQLTTLKDKLAQLQSDNETLTASDAQVLKDLDTSRGTNESTQKILNIAKSTFESLSTQIKKAAAYAGLTKLVLGPMYEGAGSREMTPQMTSQLRDDAEIYLVIIDDPVLRDKFEAMIDSGYNDTEEFGFYLYLLESMEKAAV